MPRGRTRQHFIPAAYLARFSVDSSRTSRNRLLWVYDNRAARAVPARPARVAYELGLYDASNWILGPHGLADQVWEYEGRLPAALDALGQRAALDGLLWLEVLVPFIAGLFMRGSDFPAMYSQRLPRDLIEAIKTSGIPVDENRYAQAARFIDLQFLLAPIMAMDWTVLHFPEGVNLLTTDRAYAPALSPVGFGLAVPIDLRTVVVLSQSTRRVILIRQGDNWIAPIAHHNAAPGSDASLRRSLAGNAAHAVYGPTRQVVEEVADAIATNPFAPHVPLSPPEPIDDSCHMYDYFRVLSALRAPGEATQADADRIQWDRVSAWKAPVIVDVMFPERTRGGITVLAGRIVLDLTFGAVIQRFRRALGDPRRGAYSFISLDRIRQSTGPTPALSEQRVIQLDYGLLQYARHQIVTAVVGRFRRFAPAKRDP